MKGPFVLFLFFLSAHAYAQKQSLVKPIANISGLTKGAITAEQFRNAKQVSVSDTGWVVTSFTFSAYGAGGKVLIREFKSNEISSEVREAIASFPPGTKIYFEYIKAEDAHGNRLLLSALAFTLSK